MNARGAVPHLERTPWRDRLIVWPGMPFRTLPFPYLFDRWDVRDPDHGWVGSYFTRRAAERGLCEWVAIKDQSEKGGLMGWWTQDEQGRSFQQAEGAEMLWGDGPADIMGNALDEIEKEFEREHGRKPTKAELRAGLEFSLGGIED